MSGFETFVADLHTHLTNNPNDCVVKGIDDHLDELPDPSLAYADALVADARALLSRADDLDQLELPFDSALDVDLARLLLQARVHDNSYRFNGRTRLEQLPKAGDGVGDGVFLLFVNDPRPAGERLADITGRLEKVRDYTEAMLARLDTPLRRWRDMDLDKVSGLPTLFANIEAWAETENWPDLARLSSARRAAEAALSSYSERLRALPTTEQLHVGEDIARRIVALRGIDMSLEELHVMARDFLAETNQTLAELRGRLVAKYDLHHDATDEQVHGFLNHAFRVDMPGGKLSVILDRYQEEREKVVAFIRERDLFPILPEQDMCIMQTPEFMVPSISAGAMMQPPAFRAGIRRSMIYLTLSEALLDEHTTLGIPGMIIHEGIPGHHLQLATASTHASYVRRHFEAMEHAEGWTTMLEDFMLDIGYMGELTDEARFVGKRDLARIGARVAIDLFFMTGDRGYLDVGVDCDIGHDNPFKAAGTLLHAVTGFTPGRLECELNWYSEERGYPLCYLTGNRQVWKLKRRYVAAQQGKLSDDDIDRSFHRIYLESGNMPLTFLARVFEHRGLT